MAAVDSRRRVMDEALSCFLEDGYEQTTIAHICQRSRVSNGALFHQFPSKGAIADALYVEAMASAQEGLWALVRSRPRSLRVAVRGAITNQLNWVEQHVDLARFVYMRGHLDWDSPASTDVTALNRDLGIAFREWMDPFVQRGEIRSTSMLMISAIVTGPAHTIAQRWLAGQLEDPLTGWVDDLTDAACAALRGTRRRGVALPPNTNSTQGTR